MSLNPNATNVPYLLGRLFSVLEAIQAACQPGINATIRDKVFQRSVGYPCCGVPRPGQSGSEAS